jgi:hypothetical protein
MNALCGSREMDVWVKVKPVREAGPPRTKEFDFGPLRLELVRQAA